MSNIILIGMPGAGKSTIGKRLAVHFDKKFIDADDLLEKQNGHPIQYLLDCFGLNRLSEMEEKLLCSLNLENHVISTGGSAVYSEIAMRHLKDIGLLVYLSISNATLLKRVDNVSSRGLVKLPKDTLSELYHQRTPLYEKWAEVTFDNNRPLSAWQFAKLVDQIDKV